jgi:hypothetical protein
VTQRESFLQCIRGAAVSVDPWTGWQAFSEAARRYLDSTAGASCANAAQQFSDFLRQRFATYSQHWAGAPAQNAPAFGATREHQQRAQRMADAVQRMDAAQRRLQRLWSDVLKEAATQFVSQLSPMPSGAATPESLRKLYDTWIDCAEDAYARVAHGEEFCQAQGELANAASLWRLEQQASIEHFSKFLDLPTRSEINSLTRRLRAVEQRLRAATGKVAKTSPRPRTVSTRRSKAKKRRS